jgi:hypothetical protein
MERGARRSLLIVLLAGVVAAVLIPVAAATTQPAFRVRVLNAAADSTGVDVVIDAVQVANNAPFRTITSYLSAPEGNYQLSVYPAGKRSQAAAYVYKRGFFFHSPKDYTIIVMGQQANNTIDASIEVDRNTLDGSNNAQVRLGNFIPGTGALTLATGGTNTALGTAKFGETDNYVAIAAGTYTLALYDGNGGTVTKDDGVALGPNTTVSVFALGLSVGTPGPSLLVNVDNGTAPAQPAPTPTAASNPSASASAVAPTTTASGALRQALVPVPAITNTDTKVFFAATGHTLGGTFKTYWDSHGGLMQFGYPISEEYQEVSLTDGKTYTTQYFERARFEEHPENAGTPYEVLQGLLGREMLKLQGVG